MTTRTRTDQYQARWAKTEAKLREALERLTNSQPTHPELLQKRRLRFDVSELALEAGVSRNAIYSSHPSFLDQLKALKTAREPLPGRLATTHDKIAELNGIIRTLKGEVQVLVSRAAAQVARTQAAERKLAECERRCQKLHAKLYGT